MQTALALHPCARTKQFRHAGTCPYGSDPPAPQTRAPHKTGSNNPLRARQQADRPRPIPHHAIALANSTTFTSFGVTRTSRADVFRARSQNLRHLDPYSPCSGSFLSIEAMHLSPRKPVSRAPNTIPACVPPELRTKYDVINAKFLLAQFWPVPASPPGNPPPPPVQTTDRDDYGLRLLHEVAPGVRAISPDVARVQSMRLRAEQFVCGRRFRWESRLPAVKNQLTRQSAFAAAAAVCRQ